MRKSRCGKLQVFQTLKKERTMSAAQKLDCTVSVGTLYVALELGERTWKCFFSRGLGERAYYREVSSGWKGGLLKEIRLAKERFGLAEDCRVISCYEAGRDGFWLHRWLVANRIENVIVDSSSIEVQRRKRRAKSDRLDAAKLLTMLQRYDLGESRVWRVVNVPSAKEEDQRQLHRELMTLTRERTRQINRIKGLLASQGIALSRINTSFVEEIEKMRLWDGSSLARGIQRRLRREFDRLVIIDQHIHEIEEERLEELRHSTEESVEKARRMMDLRGIGINSAWLYSMELFSWRKIRNRRELGSLVGLTPTPYNSGESERDQGISKAGNRWIRSLAIEIAWRWVQYQPTSELTQWFRRRFGSGSKRQRKIGIVALARKLVIALWRFVETGEIPQGAQLVDGRTKLRCRGGRLC
jgi:transposase